MSQLELVYVRDYMNPNDKERAAKLGHDMRKVYEILSDGKPHLTVDIANALQIGEPSAQAQCRNLRKKPFYFNVQCQRITKGLNYYILKDGFYKQERKE